MPMVILFIGMVIIFQKKSICKWDYRLMVPIQIQLAGHPQSKRDRAMHRSCPMVGFKIVIPPFTVAGKDEPG